MVESLEARWLLAADVVISELMYHPNSEAPQDEWFELYNRGDAPANLAGWKVDQGVHYNFAGGTLGAGQYLVVAANVAAFESNYPGVANVVGGWTGKMSNQGEQLRVVDAGGATVDQVTFASQGDWAQRLQGGGYEVVKSITHNGTTATVTMSSVSEASGDTVQIIGADQSAYNGTFTVTGSTGNTFTYTMGSTPSTNATGPIVVRRLLDHKHMGWAWGTLADGGGRSLELINPTLSNNDGQNWTASAAVGGTPGGPNSVASVNIAPEITNVKLSPVVPKSTDTVTVTAKLIDELPGAASATLHWRLDAATPGSFAAVAMHDDGANGDAVAGDGTWTAQIPPQADGKIVEVYISSTDGALSRTWPAPAIAANGSSTQSTNLLYQVDDNTYTGPQPIFRLIMTQNEAAELTTIGNISPDDLSNAAMNGTFISIDPSGTEARYTIGIRNRGGGSRTASINNYRIELNNDQTWNGRLGLNLNAEYSMEDVLGSAIAQAAGVPGQRVIPVQVRVNGANLASPTAYDMFGSYSYLEVENSDMVDAHFPADPKGNYYRAVDGSHAADLRYTTSVSTLHSKYPKQTNSPADDYSDLIALMAAFDPAHTPDANFVSAMQQNVNVAEWLRYFAVNSLIGNVETALATGYGDDYSLYSGVNDPRFQIIMHDLDTIMGQGDSPGSVDVNRTIFQAADGAGLGSGAASVKRLLENPTFSPLYYQTFLDLINTTFAPANIDALIDNTLGAYVPQAVRDSMKQFAHDRANAVLAQIPRALTATSTLAQQNGYYHTTSNTTSLSGTTDVTRTKTVLVNGQPANYTYSTSTHSWSWNAPSVSLRNGINRILVQALDSAGKEILRTYIDVWSEQSAPISVPTGTLSGNIHWTPGVYRVTGSSGSKLTIPAGSSLTIDPGVTVFFDAGVGLTINGQLTAIGNELQRIRFAKYPTASGAWDRILVTNTQSDSKIAYADQDGAGSGSENIQVINARLDTDHMTWLNTTTHIVDYQNASFRLTNSILPDTTNVEPAHFHGMPANGYALVQGNIFGHVTGQNDVFDFTGGKRPGPIFNVIDNIFLGTGPGFVDADDILDIDGTDAHIEGNVFMDVQRSPSADLNAALSGGQDSGDVSNVVSVRNIFFNVSHMALMKEGNMITSINDTIINVQDGTFTFYEPGNNNSGPGAWAMVDGDIMYGLPLVNGAPVMYDQPPTGTVTVTHSIVPGDSVYPGTGNSNADPHLNHVTAPPDFSQMDNSAALAFLRDWFGTTPDIGPGANTGPNGTNMGATNPPGATISGEPAGATTSTTATLSVGNKAIYAYRWKLDDGAWSAPVATINPGSQNPVVPPISLSGLSLGEHTVSVIEENSAGYWQDINSPTVSKTWTVVSTLAGHVRINEILADNNTALTHNGKHPDVIELYNDGGQTVNLADMSITDDPTDPRQFVFPAGTTIAPGQYLTLYADKPDGSDGIHLGFSLGKSGDQVRLYDTPESGGAELDSVAFGPQLRDLSIGRVDDGSWSLTQPTFGLANVPAPLGNPAQLRINEWLAHGVAPFNNDFIELYNADSLPVNMGGLSLTDQPSGYPDRSPIPALSFVAGSGYAVFTADGNASKGADHTSFSLSDDRGEIGLFDANLARIDAVVYGTQRPGISQGPSPDGGLSYAYFTVPNPGVANPAIITQTHTSTINLITKGSPWYYNDGRKDLGNGSAAGGWATPEYANQTNTTLGWHPSPALALFWAQNGSSANLASGWNKTTPLAGVDRSNDIPTYYFRTHFNIAPGTDLSTITDLTMRAVVDDGAIVYLNGHPVYWDGVAVGATFNTWASKSVGDANTESIYVFPQSALQYLTTGDNVIAVELHQTNATSHDIAWGATLTATQTTVIDAGNPPDLRITEVNYAPPGGGTLSGAPLTGDDYEFVEVKNIGTQPINLGGIRFMAGIDYTFGNSILQPGQVGVVVKNAAAFAQRYGGGINILGEYSGSLDDSGEEIRLVDANGTIIHDFAYSPTWSPSTASGHTLQIIDPAADTDTWNTPSSWTASTFDFGSPGMDAPSASPDSVVVNEVLSHSHQAELDWIELYNTTDAPIDISGWYLSDSINNLNKFRIPANTTIPSHAYLSFDESQFNDPNNPNDLVPFSFSEASDDAYLTAADPATGYQTGYRQGWRFGAADTGVTLGRYQRSTGDYVFTALESPTRDAANAAPKFGPVVINEIMYHPAAGADEYIELKNVSNAPVQLFDPLAPANTWKFTSGIQFDFPQDSSIAAGGYALVVPIDPADFRAKYAIPDSVQIFGPYTGALDNAGQRVTLSSPGDTEMGTTPYIVQDTVKYSDVAPWPTAADGGGASLARVAGSYGDDVVSWVAEQGGSPGFSTGDAIVSGTSGDDVITLRVNGPNIEVFVNKSVDSDPTATYPLATTTQLPIHANGGTDTVTLASAMPFLPIIDAGGGSVRLNIDAGSYTIGADLADPSLTLAVSGASVQLDATQHLAGLSIGADGLVKLNGGSARRHLMLGSLDITGNGMLDLYNNDLILTYTGQSPEARIQDYARAGLDTANPSGLVASHANLAGFSQSLRALAVFDNHDAHFVPFDGEELASDYNQVIVKYTYLGDANGDGKVDPTDYAVVDGKIGLGHSWITGDLNFDGKVDPSDYAQVDGNQGAGQGGVGGPQLAEAGGVAEPVAALAALPEAVSAGGETAAPQQAVESPIQGAQSASAESGQKVKRQRRVIDDLLDGQRRRSR